MPTRQTPRNPPAADAEWRARQLGEAPRRIPILVVEDNRLVRDGIVSILNRHDDLVVAAAGGADTALQHLAETPPPPPVVVVDASLTDQNCATLVYRITQTTPEARVIVMDLVPGPEDIVEFIRAGARGLIMKDATVDVFVRTIRLVATGRDVLPPALTGSLFSQIAQHAGRRPTRTGHGSVRLTRREREVIELIAEGLSNKEIAQQINLSPHTVKSHVHNILEKLALHSRLQVAAYVHHGAQDSESS